MGGAFTPCGAWLSDERGPGLEVPPSRQATLERLISLTAERAKATGNADAIGRAFEARRGYPPVGHHVPILEYAADEHAQPGDVVDFVEHDVFLVTIQVAESMKYLLQGFLGEVYFDAEAFRQARKDKKIGPTAWEEFLSTDPGAGVPVLEDRPLREFIDGVIEFLEGDGRVGFLVEV